MLNDLNLTYCFLVALLSRSTGIRAGEAINGEPANCMPPIVRKTEEVKKYVIALLGGDSSPSRPTLSLSVTEYRALLPSLWSLIDNHPSSTVSPSPDVLEAIIRHAIRVSSKSSVKGTTIEFVASLAWVSHVIDFWLTRLIGVCVPALFPSWPR